MNELFFEGDNWNKLNHYAWKLAWTYRLPPTMAREDLVQTGLEYVWRRREEWTPEDRFYFHAWAWKRMKTGMNLAVNRIIGHKTNESGTPGMKRQFLNDTFYAEEDYVFGEDRTLDSDFNLELQAFLKTLTDKQRKAFVLRAAGYTHREIHEMTGMDSPTVTMAFKKKIQEHGFFGIPASV